MADSRFYESTGPLPLARIVELTGGQLVSESADDFQVESVEPAETTRAGALSFVAGKILPDANDIADNAVLLVGQKTANVYQDCRAHLIVCDDPRYAFGRVANQIIDERPVFDEPRISASAMIGEGGQIASTAYVGAGATIGARVRIGPGSVIGPGVVIGDDSHIAANCVVRCALIGAAANLKSGAAIGEAGFGVAPRKGVPMVVPHFGRVVIGDNILIGSNSGVDRGLFGDTRIGDNCKFDNLTHVAHNVVIGDGCIFAAYAAISGSCTIGSNTIFAGRSGLSDHVNVGSNAIMGAGSAAMEDVPDGEFWMGTPAMPKRKYVRERMAVRRLVIDQKNKKQQGE